VLFVYNNNNMAVGLVMNSGMANGSLNSYDRSRFSLDLPVSSFSAPSTSRLRHWDMSPTDSSPIEVIIIFFV